MLSPACGHVQQVMHYHLRPDGSPRQPVADEKKGLLPRLPPAVLAEVRRWADQEMRSVNGQIERILRAALRARLAEPAEPPAPGDDEAGEA